MGLRSLSLPPGVKTVVWKVLFFLQDMFCEPLFYGLEPPGTSCAVLLLFSVRLPDVQGSGSFAIVPAVSRRGPDSPHITYATLVVACALLCLIAHTSLPLVVK